MELKFDRDVFLETCIGLLQFSLNQLGLWKLFKRLSIRSPV
jgi:hypothetical protein